MMQFRNLPNRLTLVALVAIIGLVAISLWVQRNADWYSGDNFYDKQVIWFLVGGVVFAIASFIDLRLVERSAYLVLGLSVVLLIATALFGTEVNSSKRWLRFGDFNVQASELTKLGVVLALSRFLHGKKEHVPGAPPPDDGPYNLRQLLIPALIVVVPTAMVLFQPDLGTSLLISLVAATLLVYEGVRGKTLLALTFALLIAFPLAWKYGGIQEYQKDRVRGWVNAEWVKIDPETGVIAEKRAIQSEQAMWAIGSGEFWGQGARRGQQARLEHLPEMHTDMIVATYAAEQGFIGCTFLLVLFWLVLVWGQRTAYESRDRFCALLSVGVASMIGWQVFINIGMVAGLLPIVGLPLPFLSYGGSASITTLASLGLVFNVALRRGRL